MNRHPLFGTDHDLAALVPDATEVAPSNALLDRVHASRAEGFRVMLPSGDAAVVPVSPPIAVSAVDTLTVEQLARRVWLIAIAVAATLVAAVTSLWPRPGSRDQLPGTAQAVPRQSPVLADSPNVDGAAATTASLTPRESLLERLSPWPRVAFAQSLSAVERNAPYPALRALDETRLTTGRRSYLRSVGNALHELLPFTTYTVELDSALLGRERTWRLVTVTQTATGLADNSEQNADHDTVWLRRQDLRPVRRSRVAGFLRMRQTFSDSLLVETDSLIAPRGSTLRNGMRLMPFRSEAVRTLDARIPFVPTEEAMRLLLRATPLRERWRASVGALSGDNRSFAMGEPAYLNLRVDGTRDVQTLSGRFATWRVVLETGPKPEVWYVSKETGETLLTEGSWGVSYPVSETRLLYGFEETNRVPVTGKR